MFDRRSGSRFTSSGRSTPLAASKDEWANATLLHAEDIADTIAFVVTRPPRVVMSELPIRPDGSRW